MARESRQASEERRGQTKRKCSERYTDPAERNYRDLGPKTQEKEYLPNVASYDLHLH